MTATLCDLAVRLPLLVGRLLDPEGKLKRGRCREETMTDLLTSALAAFAGPELVIEYLSEAAAGGDLDLRFWHAASGRELHLWLQSRRAAMLTHPANHRTLVVRRACHPRGAGAA